MTDDYRSASQHRIKMQIDAALREQYVRSASHIVEIIKRALDLVDEQPPPVLESLIDYCCDLQRTDKFPKERVRVREAFVEYFTNALQEARERERRLVSGITGLPDDEDKSPKG